METNGIRIVTLAGSVRPGNFTSAALSLVIDELSGLDDVAVDAINPADFDLGFPGTAKHAELSKLLQARVSPSTGVVIATPEYHGSFSSVTKLLIEHLNYPSVLGGKPIALLGVAAGAIGAIKSLEHLRSVCSHVGGIVLPGPVSVASVKKSFDAEGHCTNEAVEQRVRGLAHNLIDYIRRNLCPRICMEQIVREEG